MKRVLDSQELSDVVELVSKGTGADPAALARNVQAQTLALANDLRSYGEEVVASAVEGLSAFRIDSICSRGIAIAFTGTSIPISMCLAAVEEVEGKARPLARKRRRSAT